MKKKKSLVGWISKGNKNGYYFNTIKRYVDINPIKVRITIEELQPTEH
jgi:hypothetical protein